MMWLLNISIPFIGIDSCCRINWSGDWEIKFPLDMNIMYILNSPHMQKERWSQSLLVNFSTRSKDTFLPEQAVSHDTNKLQFEVFCRTAMRVVVTRKSGSPATEAGASFAKILHHVREQSLTDHFLFEDFLCINLKMVSFNRQTKK